ncbi:MAG: hypothetical protein CBC35_04900 [Planctomycetes bacterium TMED75]|nr:DNA-3-methyladenine glycosylase [Planctomycetaceae bacterium]OUU93829.1 MAG: hypothetical protein CBC35_04900 [Planctomycetes bacterium TMED75]
MKQGLTQSQIALIRNTDHVLHALLTRLGPFPDLRASNTANSHFHALARNIIYQQLAGKAAATIHNRFRALTPGKRFPTAPQVHAMRNTAFRKAGISAGKQKALKALAGAVVNETLPLRSLYRLEDQQIINELTLIHGIGEWTAQMFLMFRLGRLDVMPATDLGVQEGMRILDQMDRRPTPSELRDRARIWKPFRSVATWCLYRVVDEQRAKRASNK